MDLKRFFPRWLIWVLVGLLGFFIVLSIVGGTSSFERKDTSTVLDAIASNEVRSAKVLGGDTQEIQLTLKNGDKIRAPYIDGQQVAVTSDLQEQATNGALPEGWTAENPRPGFFSSLLGTLLPFILFGALILFFLSQAQGGGSRVMNFGKSKAKAVSKDTPKTTFADVAGSEEAIEELQEIKDFLQDPVRFQNVGAKIPKGVLLYGPPGTGKTLLARAVAGEAGVPFYSISGSDFVEMFVGVGASRVRDLFNQAKENAPAIIFVDEIDAVGRHRGAGLGGGHDEREQTLNQLLVEMDGFDVKTNVILIAATNRPDILDPALLRPGRFDRQIGVEAPDLNGRLQILKVHARGKPLGDDIDLMAVARRTPGFTGADLANVLNEAALLTARGNGRIVDAQAMDEAIDRVVAGPQKRSRIMNENEKKITAYHEGGHALVAAALRHTDPVHKITILSRGRALGYTMVLPDEDKYSTTRNEMLDQLAYMMGGRAAEELVFHDPTTGAANDIEKASTLARRMVTQYGMTERLGAIKFGTDRAEPFLGRDMGHERDYSEQVAAVVDDEVRRFIESAHQEAFDILVENRDILDDLVLELLEKETLDKEQVAAIFTHIHKHPPRPAWTGSPSRVPSERPPVAARPRLEGSNGSSNGSPAPAPAPTPAAAGSGAGGGAGAGGAGQAAPGSAERSAQIERAAQVEREAQAERARPGQSERSSQPDRDPDRERRAGEGGS